MCVPFFTCVEVSKSIKNCQALTNTRVWISIVFMSKDKSWISALISNEVKETAKKRAEKKRWSLNTYIEEALIEMNALK